MTTGEGGAVTTAPTSEHELLVSLRNQGRLETSSWLQHGASASTTASTTSPPRSGSASWRSSTGSSTRDARSRRAYDELLAGLDVETPLADDADHVRSWFVYVVKLPRGVDRDAVMARLAREGIAYGAVPAVDPPPVVHARALRLRARGCCPVSEDCSARTMALPFHARLDRADQERVVERAPRRARLSRLTRSSRTKFDTRG